MSTSCSCALILSTVRFLWFVCVCVFVCLCVCVFVHTVHTVHAVRNAVRDTADAGALEYWGVGANNSAHHNCFSDMDPGNTHAVAVALNQHVPYSPSPCIYDV